MSHWIPATTTHFFFSVPIVNIVTEILHRFLKNQNRSNNLSILPDLDSYRISIHSPNISGHILGRFGGFITDFVSVIPLEKIIILTLRHNV